MSNENENQIIPEFQSKETVSSQEKMVITCSTCEATINSNDAKLVCPNKNCGLITCQSCINIMFDIMFGQPHFNYPLRCGSCQNAFNETDLNQVIANLERYEQCIACLLPLFWATDCLQENEKLAQCPFCPYIEIHTTDACSLHFLTCQNPSCGKRSCLICLHEIIDDNDESIHRSRCVQFHSYKEMIEKAIETGSQQRCPHCDLAGIKDDGCTHMICQRCDLSWCYLCGMKEEECLVEDGEEQTLVAHNQDWEQHEGRCPMSLVCIHELDDRWPAYDRDCLEYFHRYRTLCQLYDVLKIVGEETFDELNNSFGIIDASGYTIDEIKDYENRLLIIYPSNEEN